MLVSMDRVRQRVAEEGGKLKQKRHESGWVLPKQPTSFAPEGTWTNVDLDVTPPERRVWTTLSVLGYWISDIVGSIFNP
jgi:NCS1 family nucleobase:cation symporter-1